jgi:penicillin-binding protein 2
VQKLLEDQLVAAAELHEAPGASGVVEDPRNGAILAMASVPSYDPTSFINGIGDEEYEELTDPENGQALLNRAVAGEYAPGSTFKVVTAVAGLRSGLVQPGDSFYDDGTYEVQGCPESDPSCAFNNAGEIPNGNVNLQTSLTVSSDWYYYRIGDNLWGRRDQLGDDYLQQTAADFGFTAETGVDLPSEREGFAFTPEIVADLHEENPVAFPYGEWTSGNTINMSIGQGDLGVTPLQLTNAYAAIANGGTLYRPHLGQATWEPTTDRWNVDEETSCRETEGDDAGDLRRDGAICTVTPVQLGAVEIPDQWRDPMVAGLLGVQSGSGTAAGAFEGFDLGGFPIAGKTGTAQVTGKGDFALYVGFGPVRPGQQPEYVISVILEAVDQFGGEVAAPVARAVFDGLANPALLPVVNSTEATPLPTTDTGDGAASTTTTVPQ